MNGNLNLKTKIIATATVLVVAFILSIVYFSNSQKSQEVNIDNSQLRSFTLEELSKYNGEDASQPIYIGFNGYVYDVTEGSKFYSKGKSYNYLVGKDSSDQLNLIGGDIIKRKYQIIGKLTQ